MTYTPFSMSGSSTAQGSLSSQVTGYGESRVGGSYTIGNVDATKNHTSANSSTKTANNNNETAPNSTETKKQPEEYKSTDTEQYNKKVSNFFDLFNRCTGRPQLYFGIINGLISKYCKLASGKNHVAADVGCGTGWLPEYLLASGFNQVYGIDTSPDMLEIASARMTKTHTNGGSVAYKAKMPESVEGKCDVVTAVHVHYHFSPENALIENFFAPIKNALKEGGHFILIGCPSDHIKNPPSHYDNHIPLKIIPQPVLDINSDLEPVQDEDGYVPLSHVKGFDLKDGTEMKARFYAKTDSGEDITESVKDTFWKDETLIESAKKAGLSLVERKNIPWAEKDGSSIVENAYMYMVFKRPKPRKSYAKTPRANPST